MKSSFKFKQNKFFLKKKKKIENVCLNFFDILNVC